MAVGKVVKPAQLLGEDLAKLDDKSHHGRCAPFDSDLHGGGRLLIFVQPDDIGLLGVLGGFVCQLDIS